MLWEILKNSKTMINIYGIGWINEEEYGCIMKGIQVYYKDNAKFDTLSKKGIFSYPFKNFGRLDKLSKMTCYSAALALKDAGIKYSPNQKQDIGISGTNASGSFQSDINYFKDYLDSGRTLSRGNLFIYTLPTSPLAEASIHLGLQGPLLYAAGIDKSLMPAMDMAAEMILFDEAPIMLAGMAEENEAVYFVLARNSDSKQNILYDFAQAKEILARDLIFSRMIKEFSTLKKEKGRK